MYVPPIRRLSFLAPHLSLRSLFKAALGLSKKHPERGLLLSARSSCGVRAGENFSQEGWKRRKAFGGVPASAEAKPHRLPALRIFQFKFSVPCDPNGLPMLTRGSKRQ